MTPSKTRRWGRLTASTALGLVSAVALCASPAAADTAPSENLTVNLIRLMVKQGLITQAAADQLMAQAQRETAEARAMGSGSEPVATNLPPAAPGSQRITYVPQVVQDQIKDQVIAQAKAENWAQPNAVPAWTKRIEISGDVRARYESDLYSNTNDSQIVNFAALNASGPVDVNPATNLSGVPILNTRQDRNGQVYIRARLDLLARPSDWVTAEIRVASGTSNTPVSTSQLLGGGLTKKNLWLDRAYLDLHPTPWAGLSVGRMPNPFFSTDLVYDTDLNFDGGAGRLAYDLLPEHGISLFASSGAFLTGYQDANFPSNSTSDQKSSTEEQWMLGVQGGAQWKTERFKWKTAVAYYAYENNRGELSEPCALYSGVTQCSTDWSVPAFMQKGNSLFLIRDITPNPTAGPGDTPLPEYAGLVFPFRILNLTSSFDLALNNGKHLELTGDYARNLAYRWADACRYGEAGLPITNVIAPEVANTDVCSGQTGPNAPKFQSGPNAFMVRATYGDPDPFEFGRWNITAGYKYLAPDSMPDAYTDADFHLGGTNAKGYFILANFGLLTGSNIEFRWFSSDQVYGAPLAIDVGQVDLNARF